MTQGNWEEIAARKRKQLADSIPELWVIPVDLKPGDDVLNVTEWSQTSRWFTDEEQKITSTPASSLLQKLTQGEWSAENVARAFCKKAAAAQQLTNCLTATLFDQAIERAKYLDDYLRQHKRPIGPLHGLPISLKDNFLTKGVDSTVGFASYVDNPAEQDAVLVELLRDAGAVFYVKTNVPTAMMIPETVNNVFGRCVNPLNRGLTPGGSSGGESALIAFGGSVLGVGTDIGGSLRIPAACTGIFTLKPSLGRFPTARCQMGLAGQEAVSSVNGPMSPHLDSIELWARTVVGAEPWDQDPKCLPIPWRDVPQKEKLKIGVYCEDGFVTPTPPVQRAWRQTVEKLKKAGHEIVEWDVRLHLPIMALLRVLFLADGGKTVRDLLEPTGEPFRPEMWRYEEAKEVGSYTMWRTQLERTGLSKQYLDLWNSYKGLDAILGPTTPFAAPQNGKFNHVGFTCVFNVLDYSSVSFPTGVHADRGLDVYPESYTPLSDVCKVVHDDYDGKAVHGMPVSLQLTARRLEEEKLLMMTRRVLDAVGS